MNKRSNELKAISDQVVLLLQGGGALGAYQVGVYQTMHKNRIEPDWIIGTSIGAINASIIAGNPPETRLDKLKQFWKIIESEGSSYIDNNTDFFSRSFQRMSVILLGVNGFFKPRTNVLPLEFGQDAIDKISYYDTGPLKSTLSKLVDFDYLNSKQVRLMLGAVNANSGEMNYFDNQKMHIRVEHIMASAALPPAFPAIIIDGEPYWDGGICSNSPDEVFMNTLPRLNSVIFSVNLWNERGLQAKSLLDIQGRLKDIQFSSKASQHIKKEIEIHKLRRAVDILISKLSPAQLRDCSFEHLRELGCNSQMHFIRFMAPVLPGDDFTKDINFSSNTIKIRMETGVCDAETACLKKPWDVKVPLEEGIMIYNVCHGAKI